MRETFKAKVSSQMNYLKHPKYSMRILTIPILKNRSRTAGSLKVFTSRHVSDNSIIALLARWRRRSSNWFPAQFRVTKDGTRRWALDQILEKPDRILFLIQLPTGTLAGHVGLNRFDYARKMCEIDNIVRGRKSAPGLMYLAVLAMMRWAEEYLGVTGFSLRVFSDNERAIRLYTRLGFRTVKTIPLCRLVDAGVVRWEEIKKNKGEIRRYYLQMERKEAP